MLQTPFATVRRCGNCLPARRARRRTPRSPGWLWRPGGDHDCHGEIGRALVLEPYMSSVVVLGGSSPIWGQRRSETSSSPGSLPGTAVQHWPITKRTPVYTRHVKTSVRRQPGGLVLTAPRRGFRMALLPTSSCVGAGRRGGGPVAFVTRSTTPGFEWIATVHGRTQRSRPHL